MSWNNPYSSTKSSDRGTSCKAAIAAENHRRVQLRKAEEKFTRGLRDNYSIDRIAEIHADMETSNFSAVPVPAKVKRPTAVIEAASDGQADTFREMQSFEDDMVKFEVTHGGANIWTSDSQGNIAVRSGLNGTTVHSLTGDGTLVTALWASPTHMFIGMADGTVRVYDHTLFIHITEGAFHTTSVVAFVPLWNRRTVSCAADGTLVKWDNENNGFEALLKVVTGHTAPLTCAVATSHHVYSGSEDRTIRAVDCDTGESVAAMEGHPGIITCMAVLEQYLFSTCTGMQLRVWNLLTHQVLKTVSMSVEIAALVVDRGSMRLWAARQDGTIEVWVAQDNDEIAVERTISTGHTHPVTGMRLQCAVDSVKIWSIGSNGVNKVWFSCVNRVEQKLNENIGALKAVIAQDTVEIDRWRQLIEKLRQLDTRRKTHISNALAAFHQDSLRRRALFIWQCYVHALHLTRRKATVSNRLANDERLRLLRRYYSILFRYSRSRRMARLKETFVRVQLRHVDGNSIRVYFAKLQAFVRGMKEAKIRRELSVAFAGQSQRGLMRAHFRKWLKFATSKRTTRQKASYVACILRTSEQSLLRVYYIKFRTLTTRFRDRKRKQDAARLILSLSVRSLRRHAFNAWLHYLSRVKAQRRRMMVASAFLANTERGLTADCYRRWHGLRFRRLRERREKERQISEGDLAMMREKYAELQLVVEMKRGNDELAAQLEAKRSAIEERKMQLMRLRNQRDELVELMANADEEAARRQLSVREQLANLIARIKAKVLNFNADFSAITQIREKAKQIPVRQIFLEEHQKVKRIVVDLTRKPHLPTDQEWPLTIAMLSKIPSFQMAVLLSSIKGMIITFDMMDKATRDSMATDQEIVINAKWLLVMADLSMEHRRASLGGKR